MSDNFKSNFGTVLQIGSGSSSPYTYSDIKGVFVVPPIESEQEKIEVTHHDQNSPYRKYIPSGLIDPGDYQFQMRSDRSDSTQQSIYTLYKSGEIGHWAIIHSDGLMQAFDAYVEIRLSSVDQAVDLFVVSEPVLRIRHVTADRAFERKDKIDRPLKCVSYFV